MRKRLTMKTLAGCYTREPEATMRASLVRWKALDRIKPSFSLTADSQLSRFERNDRRVGQPASPQERRPALQPSLPRATHAFEKARWDEVLLTCKERVLSATKAMATLPEGPECEKAGYLYAQMLGTLDQATESVGRLPTETGSLYHDDLHKLEEARKALDRVSTQWDALFR